MDGSTESPIIYFDDAGNGPNLHVCGEEVQARARIELWFDRAKLTGLHPEAVRAIDTMLKETR